MIEEVKKHERLIHQDKTEAIIGAFYAVYNTPGHGFLEKVYENALAYELLNYLRATKIEVGLVLNFGPEARFRRKAYANSRKKNIGQQG